MSNRMSEHTKDFEESFNRSQDTGEDNNKLNDTYRKDHMNALGEDDDED